MNPYVDWSQAPDDADAWEMDEIGVFVWTKEETLSLFPEPGTIKGRVVCGSEFAPSFGYTGNWQDSRTLNPHKL